MQSLKILGDSSLLKQDDEIEMIDEIKIYDFVTMERRSPKHVVMRVISPREYSTFSGILYLIEKDNEGAIQLTQAKMSFWPW